MTLPSSPNSISLKQIQTEFGGADPISISEYYRNGSYTTSNNTNVPVDSTIHPPIKFSNFYGAVAEILVVISATTTNLNISTLFGSYWTQTVPKRLVINSGVIIGATNTSNYALNIPSGFGGTVKVDNNGSIQGGGAVGSGVKGGNAIFAGAAGITINNLGTIYAGGGSGGSGGTGGNSAPIASTDIVTSRNARIDVGLYPNLTIIVAGANGGNGGVDGAYSGGTGASGQIGEFRPKFTSGYLSIFCGAKGSNGSSNVNSSTAGGAGGTGQISLNGGKGGSAGTTGTSGAGGGGGYATIVTYSTITGYEGVTVIIAGGGGGGGGGSYINTGYNGANWPWWYNGQIVGSTTITLARYIGSDGKRGGISAFGSSTTLDGGGCGGGGAGGGAGLLGPGSGGSFSGIDEQTGYTGFRASGGNSGASVYDSTKFDILSSTLYPTVFNDGITANGDGYVLLKYTRTNYGGVGGNGGRGQGYNQSAAGGGGGGGDGTNAGKGGTGGTGGAFGESGGNGFVGANGTGSTAPVLGSYFGPGSGGLAGYYIVNNANVTWITTGTRLGRVG